MILALLITGAVGGFLSGFFGVGGGIIMVPLLMMWARFDQRRASATSLAAIVPTSIVGALSYASQNQVDWLVAACVAIGAIIGAPLGSRLLRVLPIKLVTWIFVILMVVEAVRLFAVGDPSHEPVGMNALVIVGLVGLGIIMGIASGMLGIGGGVIAVPVFMAAFGLSPLLAKGTSLLAMIPTAIAGTIPNFRAHIVSLRDGAIVGVAAVAASFGGVALAFLLPADVSAQLFGVLLLIVAIHTAYRTIKTKKS